MYKIDEETPDLIELKNQYPEEFNYILKYIEELKEKSGWERRNYQIEAVLKSLKDLEMNKTSLIVMPPGTGKTFVAALLMRALLKNNSLAPVLWITHNIDLVDQAYGDIDKHVNGFSIGKYNSRIEEVEKENTLKAQIVVVTIQSLKNLIKNKAFMSRHWSKIIIDEAHHSAATSYVNFIKNCSYDKLVGLTATPYRMDNKPLELFNIVPSFTYDYATAEAAGFIASCIGKMILTSSSIRGIKTEQKEYTKAQLDKLVVSIRRNKEIVKAYRKNAYSFFKLYDLVPKTVCFCVNVDHAIYLSNFFNSNGIKSNFITADTSKQTKNKRERIFEIFSNTNEIEILCVVNILSEGVDIPDITCVLMCSPTMSFTLYVQKMGRAFRKFIYKNGIEKNNFLALDFVDNSAENFRSYNSFKVTKKPLGGNDIDTEYLDVQDDVEIEKVKENVMRVVMDTFNKVKKQEVYIMVERELVNIIKKQESYKVENNTSNIIHSGDINYRMDIIKVNDVLSKTLEQKIDLRLLNFEKKRFFKEITFVNNLVVLTTSKVLVNNFTLEARTC